ncbi:MAG TPA: translocation/assembly module TamB domain-containing protein [Rectinemataceae bacterium]|nr:translocation/assembly module TamB domain-containing protein [Rectinemataceae bacterium]
MSSIRRLLPVALAGLMITGVLFYSLGALDSAFRGRVRSAIEQGGAEFERQLGLTLSFESFSPSILHSVAFTSMTLKKPDGEIFLQASQVRVYYDVFAILRGRSYDTLKGISLQNVTANVNLPRDNELLQKLSGYVFPPPGSPAPKFTVEGRSLLLHVSAEGMGTVSLSAREMDYSNLGNTIEFSLSGNYAVSPAQLATGEIEGPIELTGTIAQDLAMARIQMALAADAADFAVATQRFELVYGNGTAELRKVRDKAPLDAALSFDTKDGTLAATLRADGFVPARSLRVRGALSALSPWLGESYRGTVSFTLPRGRVADARYSVNLDSTLPASLLPGPYHVAISADGDLQRANVSNLKLGDGARSLQYQGSFDLADLAPDGILAVNYAPEGFAVPVSASVRLYGRAGVYTALAEEVRAGSVRFRDLAITAAHRGSAVEFQASVRPPEGEQHTPDLPVRGFGGEGGTNSGGLPRISVEGSANLGRRATVDLSASLENVELEPLGGILSAALGPEAASLLGDLKLGGELFLTSDFSRLSWSVSDLAIVSRSIPGAYALLSLSGNQNSVSVRRLQVSAAGYTIAGTGSVDMTESGRVGFEASLSLKDIPYQVKGALVEQGLFITGDYGLNLSAHRAGDDTFFSASARAFPIPVAGGVALMSLDLDGRYSSPGDWRLAVGQFELDPADPRLSSLPTIAFSGALGPTSGSFPTLHVADAFSSLDGSFDVDYSLTGAGAATLKLDLSQSQRSAAQPAGSASPTATGAAGSESYHARLVFSGSAGGELGDGRLSGSLTFSGLSLARLGVDTLSGTAQGQATIQGTVGAPEIQAEAGVHDARWNGEALDLNLRAAYADKRLRVSSLNARYLGTSLRNGSAALSLADGSADAQLDLSAGLGGGKLAFTVILHGEQLPEAQPAAAPGPRVDSGALERLSAASAAVPKNGAGSAQADGQGPGPSLLSSLPQVLRHYQVSGSILGEGSPQAGKSSWPFILVSSSDSIKITGGIGQEFQAQLLDDGSFSARADPSLHVGFAASGSMTKGNIDATLDNIDVDLAALSSALPVSTTRFEAGRLAGALHVKGPVGDPDITGSLGLESIVLSAPDWVPAKIGPFSAPLTVAGKSLALSASDVPVGSSRLFVSAAADLDHWTPVNFRASLRTGEGYPLAVDFNIKGLQIKGEASFNLGAELRGDVLALTGALTLQRATVVLGTELFTGGQDTGSAPTRPILLQSQLHFGRGVEVFFPSRELPVVSGYADPSSVVAIHYDQSVEDLSVKGTLALRGGDVFYIQRSFFLKTATIVFNESLDHFDPRVTMLAELRDRNDQGPVLITLKTDSQPISQFKPTLSSDPPMSESDIANLLGTGLFEVSSDQTVDLRKAVISSSEFLPQLNVAKAFEQRVRDGLGLDVFFLRTQFLQRWLMDVSDPAQTATTDPLGRYLDQSALYVGKYIGDSVFLHGEARFREDPLVGAQPLRIDSELGIEFDTPFGLIQWSIAPSSPESLYIKDQSLSLTWRFSY